MDQNFYRGARPKAEDLRSLAALGVHTIIDLTDNSRDKEQPAVEAAGMRYVNIPIVDKQNPSAAQISQFFKIANDPATGKFYVHCAGGRHRTGVMAGVYRFNHDHWNYDQAYAEILKFRLLHQQRSWKTANLRSRLLAANPGKNASVAATATRSR